MSFRHFKKHDGGMTSIEYTLVAAIMGTGVLMSLNYIADELTAIVQPEGCTWVQPEESDKSSAEDGPTLCIGAPGWAPRIATRPSRTRSASASN